MCKFAGFVAGLAVALVAVLPTAAQDKEFKLEDGFTSLFNGKDLSGWEVMNKGKFSVKDGVILLDKGGGWLRSEKEYKDFDLRMDFRFVSKGADSGIFIRAGKEGGNWPNKAYQVQTMDNNSLGALFGGGKAKKDDAALKKVMKPTGEWMTYQIVAQGPKLEVKINGETITTAEGLEDRTGYIGMQGEGGVLEFKNVRIKELK